MKFFIVPALLALFAIVGGCSDRNEEDSGKQKVEPIKRGCNRCGYRKTAE